MFQYAIGRLLADMKGCNLQIIDTTNCVGMKKLQQLFPNVINITNRKNVTDNILEIGNDGYVQHIDVEKIINHDGCVELFGFFQKKKLYESKIDQIKNWFLFNDDSYIKPNKNDLVIHYRLGDYVTLGWHMFPEDYIKIIENNKIKYDNCFIVTDNPTSPLLQSFVILKNLKIINQTELADLTFIKHAKQLIISHSSFSWWGAFLGNQDKVYVPMYRERSKQCWTHSPTKIDDIDLVLDNDKFIKEII